MRKIILFSICLLFLFSYPSSIFATSCAYIELPKEEMKQADIVFKGELISNMNNRLHFDVEKVWVGDVLEDTITIDKNMWVEPIDGEDYIVFAQSRSGRLSPMSCGNTGFATEELESILDKQPIDRTLQFIIYLGIGLLAVLTGLFIFWLRKKGKDLD